MFLKTPENSVRRGQCGHALCARHLERCRPKRLEPVGDPFDRLPFIFIQFQDSEFTNAPNKGIYLFPVIERTTYVISVSDIKAIYNTRTYASSDVWTTIASSHQESA